jgi:hypothetical protein
VNGYEIRKFIPTLFNPELFDEETTKKIQTDFKKTLSELMINNLYKKSKEICNQYGLKINSEAGGPGYPLYNGPAEPLKAQGSIDIPRGEFWINHSRFYQDGGASIDIMRVVKEAAAASHIYEKGIVEEEAYTSFQHWQEGPFDMKPLGDRAFCEGMNRVVFHGFSHNITGSGFPDLYMAPAPILTTNAFGGPRSNLSLITMHVFLLFFKKPILWQMYFGITATRSPIRPHPKTPILKSARVTIMKSSTPKSF